MYTRIGVGNILQSFALGRVVEGDSDVEEGNDKGHARRLAIHGPVTRKPRQVTGVADEAVSSHDGLQPCDSLRLVDRYSYGGYTGVW